MSEAPGTLFGINPLRLATALLLATYAAVVVERLNRGHV